MIKEVLNFIERLCFGVSKVALLGIMVFTSADVLSRKIFNYSIPSLFEFTEEYLMVALVYLSISFVYVLGGHIRVTLFLKYIPEAIKPLLDKLLMLCSVILFGYIAIIGWERAFRAFHFSETSNGLIAYPLGPSFLMIPIGAGLLSIRILQNIVLPKSMKTDD